MAKKFPEDKEKLIEIQKIHSQNKKFRKFVNITQLMVFSNNMEYDDGSPSPIEGAFYASPSYFKPSFNYFREEEKLDLATLLKQENDSGFQSCQTKWTPISGGHVGNTVDFNDFIEEKANEGIILGFTYEEAKDLASVYGSNVSILYHYMIENPSESLQVSLSSVLWVKLKYALEHEMIVTPLDFFNRRTGSLLFNIESVQQHKAEVTQYMKNYFQWSDELKKSYSLELEGAIKEVILSTD